MMKKILLTTLMGSTLLVAQDISIDKLGVNLGLSNLDYTQKDHQGSIVLGNQPDTSFSSIEVYTTLNGVFEKEDIKPYISYTYSSNSELQNQYLLVGLNKYYKQNKYDLYAGILGGYGQLKWQYNPLNSTTDNKYDANSYLVGLQGGLEYPLNDTLAIGFNAKYLYNQYKTHLYPTSTTYSTIEHEPSITLSLGISYRF